jgi:cytochrome c-type biogenesis protein CcsB
MIFYWSQVNFPIFKKLPIGFILMILSNILLLSFLILRWIDAGHFPLSNLYEALMFLSWCFTLINLILEKFTKNLLLSCISSPTAFFINAFATLSLPEKKKKASPLVPALQSNWLMMHVTVMILSYAALISGSLLAIAFLILTIEKTNFFTRVDYKPTTAYSSAPVNLAVNVLNTDSISYLSEQQSL